MTEPSPELEKVARETVDRLLDSDNADAKQASKTEASYRDFARATILTALTAAVAARDAEVERLRTALTDLLDDIDTASETWVDHRDLGPASVPGEPREIVSPEVYAAARAALAAHKQEPKP